MLKGLELFKFHFQLKVYTSVTDNDQRKLLNGSLFPFGVQLEGWNICWFIILYFIDSAHLI